MRWICLLRMMSTKRNRIFRTVLYNCGLPVIRKSAPRTCPTSIRCCFDRNLSITSAKICLKAPNERNGRPFRPASQQLGSLPLQGAHNSMPASFRRFQKAEGQHFPVDRSFRITGTHSVQPDQQAICRGPVVSSPTSLACSIRYSSSMARLIHSTHINSNCIPYVKPFIYIYADDFNAM